MFKCKDKEALDTCIKIFKEFIKEYYIEIMDIEVPEEMI
jgi:hypothetical protein